MIKANRITVPLFLLAFATPFASYIWEKGRWEEEKDLRPRPDVASLTKELKSLPLASQFILTQSVDREAIVYVMATLKSTMTKEEVMANFKSSLPSLGWRFDQEKHDPYISIQYCKMGQALVIQPSNVDGGTLTHIDIKWTYYSKANGFCDADPAQRDRHSTKNL